MLKYFSDSISRCIILKIIEKGSIKAIEVKIHQGEELNLEEKRSVLAEIQE